MCLAGTPHEKASGHPHSCSESGRSQPVALAMAPPQSSWTFSPPSSPPSTPRRSPLCSRQARPRALTPLPRLLPQPLHLGLPRHALPRPTASQSCRQTPSKQGSAPCPHAPDLWATSRSPALHSPQDGAWIGHPRLSTTRGPQVRGRNLQGTGTRSAGTCQLYDWGQP